MAYLLHHILMIFSVYKTQRLSNDSRNHLVWLPVFVGLYSILPAMQFGVGTDYFNYVSIYESTQSHKLFYHKGEYIFFQIFEFLKANNLGPQSIFITVSLGQGLLFYLIFYQLKKQGLQIIILLILFFLIPGIYQNQMNGLRTFMAVPIFILAFLLKSNGKVFWTYALILPGLFSHSTFIGLIPALLLPNRFWVHLSKKMVYVYTLSLIFWISPLAIESLRIVLTYLMPYYSHYISSIDQSGTVLNILTKAYWIPLHVFFFIIAKSIRLPKSTQILIGFWAITAPLYFSLLQSGLFFRLYHYVVFFNILPAYFVMMRFKSNTLALGLLILYILLPYTLKVFVNPIGEYDYRSVLNP